MIVRGYLAGSGWKDYGRTGAVCGIPLPAGLRESERLPEPLFTPSTKAEEGHDENISLDAGGRARRAATSPTGSRDLAIALYRRGAAIAEPAGVILADTKFEFGIDPASGELLLIDEVLTPDSSRFWDAADYEPGRSQASFDKQYVRDWLETQDWDKTPPGPELPADVVAGTRAALRRGVRADHRARASSATSTTTSSGPADDRSTLRFAVNVSPKAGILDPQGRAVEGSLDHLGIDGRERASGSAGGSS